MAAGHPSTTHGLGSWYKFRGIFFLDACRGRFYGVFHQRAIDLQLQSVDDAARGLIGKPLSLSSSTPRRPASRGFALLCYVRAQPIFYVTDYMPLFSVGALFYEFHTRSSPNWAQQAFATRCRSRH